MEKSKLILEKLFILKEQKTVTVQAYLLTEKVLKGDLEFVKIKNSDVVFLVADTLEILNVMVNDDHLQQIANKVDDYFYSLMGKFDE